MATKQKHRKGLWSPDEDQRLRDYVLNYGHGCWSSVPIRAGLERNGKSCRLRWINYLRPGLKRGMFTHEEEHTLLTLHASLGNKWSQIAQHLPERTDNEIKNYWHSYLKKKTSPKLQAEDVTPPAMEKIPLEASSPPLELPRTNLPRIMFAEWLHQDPTNNQHHHPTVDFGSNGISSDIIQQQQHLHPTGIISSSSEYCNIHYNDINSYSVGSGTSGSDLYVPQPQNHLGFDHEEDQNGLIFEYFNGDDISSQLNASSDVMYL